MRVFCTSGFCACFAHMGTSDACNQHVRHMLDAMVMEPIVEWQISEMAVALCMDAYGID